MLTEFGLFSLHHVALCVVCALVMNSDRPCSIVLWAQVSVCVHGGQWAVLACWVCCGLVAHLSVCVKVQWL